MTVCYAHPRPALTVDIAILRQPGDQVEILLIQRGHPPFPGCWALPGGFVEEGETLEGAARRELWEETGVRPLTLQQLATFGAPGRDPRGWTVSVVFWGWLDQELHAQAGDDAAAAAWWQLDALPALAFDHDQIIATLLETLYE
ncbi:MAG: NUDIX hydrolase [Anaerolineae bacterium]|nr:NUDIX hydrolase [Anaerolineae bacterium]